MWPLSSVTRKRESGSTSCTTPLISISSSLAMARSPSVGLQGRRCAGHDGCADPDERLVDGIADGGLGGGERGDEAHDAVMRGAAASASNGDRRGRSEERREGKSVDLGGR